jgi:hypothetical protein
MYLSHDPKFKEVNSFLKMLLNKNNKERVCKFKKLQKTPFYSGFNFVSIKMLLIIRTN